MTDIREDQPPEAAGEGRPPRRTTRAAAAPPPAPGEQRRALLRLAAIVGAGLVVAVATGTTSTVAVVVALIVMIMLHELGHYVTAKWGGMKVTEYFLGFGPRLWSVRRGETDYGVKAIPAGGYVKIIGMNNLEEVEPADEPRTYRQQSYPRRLAVAVAGSAMHFLIAFVLFWAVSAVVGVPTASLQVYGLTKLESGPAPAEAAGIRVGDRVISIDGRRVTSWAELPTYVRARPGQDVRFVVERDGAPIEFVVRPADRNRLPEVLARVDDAPRGAGESVPVGFVGIEPRIVARRANPFAAVGVSARNMGSGLVTVGKALGSIFSPSGAREYVDVLTGHAPPAESGDGGETRFLSPVGFTRVASQAADQGLFEVLQLLIAINLFVGVFNLLPLLPLDGGHVAIATYEAIRSRISGRRYQVDVARLLPATYLVFMMLVFLGVSSLYLDIVRPLSNPFQ